MSQLTISSLLGSSSTLNLLLIAAPFIWRPFLCACVFGVCFTCLEGGGDVTHGQNVKTSQLFPSFISYEGRAARPIILLNLLISSCDLTSFAHQPQLQKYFGYSIFQVFPHYGF